MTAGGVGYRLMCSMNTLSSLPAAGDECRLYTHLNVREVRDWSCTVFCRPRNGRCSGD